MIRKAGAGAQAPLLPLKQAPTARQTLGTKAEAAAGWGPKLTSCMAPKAMPADPIASRQYDGHLVGAGGRIMTGNGTSLDDVTPVLPRSGKPDGRVLFVNGIMNNLGDQMKAMQGLADVTNAEVIGMHNATGGSVRDVLEAAGQKLGLRTPSVVKNTARIILDELAWNGPVRLAGHSQGGLILSQALSLVQETLKKEGHSPDEIAKAMARIEVTTFGSAATSYPDGPKYTHVLNELDPVAKGATALGYKAGKGAKMVWFKDEAKSSGDPVFGPHLLTTYLDVFNRLKSRQA